ncbi:aldo/keto reductase [Pontibacter silvestris]|uniref:Aldo/keto reductase n=1 Tax=Pontibacter silvestris TaxID=2305183 RepID=A0ABW4X1A6_9BACT|nr:aldo/keto reductase [Pontibacter silvestris]MCC9135900.1 aldo/keto reductase [Pontibacter silvestris]
MKKVEIKDSKIPALGFGTFQLNSQEARQMVEAAINAGYRHIDTAQAYQNEQAVGEAIKATGIARNDIFLTTKVWRDNLGGKDFLPSVEASLKKLQTEQVDLLLVHWPNADVPVEEYIGELVKAQEKGYTKYIGVSNHTTKLLDQVLATGADIITNQVEYHPLINQAKLYNYLRAHDITLTAYSPIAQGAVLGNEALKAIADKYGKNEVQITLRWLMQQDGVLAIPRSSKESHMKSNLNIFDFELSQDEVTQIDKLREQNKRVVNPGFAPDWD